jgi:hypothetical protein
LKEKTVADDSRSSKRIPLLAAAATLVVALAVVLTLRPGFLSGSRGEGPATDGVDSADSASEGEGAALQAAGRRAEKPLGKDPEAADAETVTYLQDQFGATITDKRTQIKAIEKLLEYLMRTYPEDWAQRVQAFLARAFPGMADQLYAAFQNMSAYNDWLNSHREELAGMEPGARRDAMREARTRFFGADADRIWAEAIRHEHILDTVDAIRSSPATASTVGEKLEAFVGAIEETYGDQAPSFLERRQAELLGNFLAIGTVQDGLHAMDPASRAEQLDNVRRGLGLDEAARQRWRELDAQRDKAWESGERYMQQREEIAGRYQGAEQARRLAELRARTFGSEAEVIGQEEESGFFRFGHRRIFGKE